MKRISKAKKVVLLVLIAVIIAGIVVTALYGFNKGLSYQKSTKIEVNIPKGYNKSDILQIADETFSDKNIQVQDIEKTNQVVSIRIKSYTEEELNNFKAKISEKYDIKEDELSVYEVEIPATKITTIITPYVLSICLVTILSVIYIALKNIKKDPSKKVIKILAILIIVEGLYFSIIAITRLPINEYTMPIALALYVATLLISIIIIGKEKE